MKEKLELIDYIKDNANDRPVLTQLHSNISKLKVQLKQSNETIKQLRKELSIARQEKGSGNLWAELNDGRDN